MEIELCRDCADVAATVPIARIIIALELQK